MAAPHNDDAEWNTVAEVLSNPNSVAEIIGAQIELEDFFRPDCRLIWEAVVQSYYADEAVDPVLIGERLRIPLSRQWGVDETKVGEQLYSQAHGRKGGNYMDHAKLVKTLADKRRLLSLVQQVEGMVTDNEMSPSEIGDFLGAEATKVATGTKLRGEILTMREVGGEYVKYLRRLRLAKEQGIELAVYTGLSFVDRFTKGIQPTELCLLGGEPGVGKSSVAWAMATGFADRQMRKPEDKRIGTLVLSLEMGLIGSAGRSAAAMTTVDSDKLREGEIDNDELGQVIEAYKRVIDTPLYWNFASSFRMSQMRALVVEAIRRHNVGLIIVDHFRMFDPDRRINNAQQEDEAKVRFLKEDIAKDLNVAVICLAHTVKMKREFSDGRPQLSDLRGSYQVAAHADQVCFMYVPHMYATENEKLEGTVDPNLAELLWRKNRSGRLGTSEFDFQPDRMRVRDR